MNQVKENEASKYREKIKKKYGDMFTIHPLTKILEKVNICAICEIHGQLMCYPYHLLKNGHKMCMWYEQRKERIKIKIEKSRQKKASRSDKEKKTADRKTNSHENNHRRKLHELVNKVQEAKKKYKNRYTYRINPDSKASKVMIICTIHGEFKMSIKHHLKGNGCAECGDNIMTKLMNTEKFAKICSKKYNNRYDYSEVKCEHINDIVTVKCLEHGSFSISAIDHLAGVGCYKCNRSMLKKRHFSEVYDKYGGLNWSGRSSESSRSNKVICKPNKRPMSYLLR